jgi:hypothetical protein
MQAIAVAAEGKSMLKNEHTERLTRAGVLAALSAVPVSVGLAVSDKPVRVFCFAVGVLLWVWAIALLFPGACFGDRDRGGP